MEKISRIQIINEKLLKSPEQLISITKDAEHFLLLEVPLYMEHSLREESLTSQGSEGLAFPVLHFFTHASCSFSNVNLKHLSSSYMEDNHKTSSSVTKWDDSCVIIWPPILAPTEMSQKGSDATSQISSITGIV